MVNLCCPMVVARRSLVPEILLALCLAGAMAWAAPLQRVANTTLQLPAAPPVREFSYENALGTLTFSNAVALASVPGETNRLFVAERDGRIVVVTNLASPTRTVFLDITDRAGPALSEEGLLALALHPGFATNGYFFVFYTLQTTTSAGAGRHNRLARFQVSATDTNAADANSELPLITQFDESMSHNGADLQFGPDGYLYVSLGDEGDPNDAYHNAQYINKDFFAGILRLDVDKRPGSLPPNPHPAATDNYAIPPDNPFVGATQFNGQPVNPAQVRTEFWAVGMRNPWRMAFDPQTGRLFCGDVGQYDYEEINHIVKGGNYGWAFREGLHAGPRAGSTPAGVELIDPVYEYGRVGTAIMTGGCVIGGVFCHGDRLAQLAGTYVFGDYNVGNLWALRYDGTNVTSVDYLTTDVRITSFGVDPRNGDVLYIAGRQGTNSVIQRFIYAGKTFGEPLPATLADTGAFSDLTLLTPHAGIVPYDINVSFWSDHANKRRWFSVPDVTAAIDFNAEGNWSFPTGTVWIKHFEMEMTNGVPASTRRLETRLLVRETNGIYGLTYRWGGSTSNAALVPEEGLDETLVVNDGGILRTQVWHYPSRHECRLCHTAVGGYALGFNTAQLNRDFDYGGNEANQLRALSDAGYFREPIKNAHALRALAPMADATSSVEYRVRSYLAANCAQCHQPGGTGRGFWDARISNPLAAANLIRGTLMDHRGNVDNRVIAPGSAAHSMLLTRIGASGSIRMPPLGSSEVDDDAVELMTEWIESLAAHQTFEEWQAIRFGSTNAPLAQALADFDEDGAANYLEYLVGTDPTSRSDAWRVDIERNGNGVNLHFPRAANRGYEIQWTTNLADAASWQPLDLPGNRPWFSAEAVNSVIAETPPDGPARFYRVRVYEP
ncbi:MAG: PQQ-dependent sugar dehydrogenase [Verrucomicrobiota bacterium]